VGFAAHERRTPGARTRYASEGARDAPIRDALVEAGAADERLRRRDACVLEDVADGEPLDFRSEHYNLSLMTPNFAPPPLARIRKFRC